MVGQRHMPDLVGVCFTHQDLELQRSWALVLEQLSARSSDMARLLALAIRQTWEALDLNGALAARVLVRDEDLLWSEFLGMQREVSGLLGG